MFKEKIIIEMKEVFKEIPFGIEHTLKVLKNAEDMMNGENIGEEEKEFISIIAILHDIGAVEAQKKYGSIDGVYQEKEGPAVAKEILKKVGYAVGHEEVPQASSQRSAAHHHAPCAAAYLLHRYGERRNGHQGSSIPDGALGC